MTMMLEEEAAMVKPVGGIISLDNLEWFIDTDFAYTDDGSTLADTDGDLIYQHTDRSVSLVDLIQVTETNRPEYKTPIVNSRAVTRFNNSDNIMGAGDSLDSVIAGADKKFSISLNMANYPTSGFVWLPSKYAPTTNDRQFLYLLNDGKPQINYYQDGSVFRVVQADASIGAGPLVLTMTYDGSIDDDDGLNRVNFIVNDGSSVSRSLIGTSGALPTIPDTDAQLTMGGYYASAPATSPVYSTGIDFGKIVLLSDPTLESLEVVHNELMDDWGL